MAYNPTQAEAGVPPASFAQRFSQEQRPQKESNPNSFGLRGKLKSIRARVLFREPPGGADRNAHGTVAGIPRLPRHAAIKVDDVSAGWLLFFHVAGGVLLRPAAGD